MSQLEKPQEIQMTEILKNLEHIQIILGCCRGVNVGYASCTKN